MDFIFFFNSVLLGVGLAMDAFSVSLANGMSDSKMKIRKMLLISGTFAIFQALMPLIGWALVHSIVQKFKAFEKIVPWIALVLLGYIGGKMIYDSIKHTDDTEQTKGLSIIALLVQGIATSIDALSVGFTIADYTLKPALVCVLIIAVVTLAICFAGVEIGKRIGNKIAGRATLFGGIILIFIGLEIFIKSFL